MPKITLFKVRAPTFALVAALLCAGCDREEGSADSPGSREGRVAEPPAGAPSSGSQASTQQQIRGPISEGERAYGAFNCGGCHGPNGGGGIGPPLSDGEWIYGSSPENIKATIVEGRPNGMPSFRETIDEARLEKLVAFVQSMSDQKPEPPSTP